jgi:NADH-quinone oxidoreductase subunit F
MHESCGKCTPCREGTRWMVDILQRIEEGRAEQGELDLLLSVCDRILGKCLCPLGDAAAMPVASYVAKFRDEYQRHLDEGGCPFHGESSLEGLVAPVMQHHQRLSEYAEIPVDVAAGATPSEVGPRGR